MSVSARGAELEKKEGGRGHYERRGGGVRRKKTHMGGVHSLLKEFIEHTLWLEEKETRGLEWETRQRRHTDGYSRRACVMRSGKRKRGGGNQKIEKEEWHRRALPNRDQLILPPEQQLKGKGEWG